MCIKRDRFINYLTSPKTEKIEARVPDHLRQSLFEEFTDSEFSSFSSYIVWKLCHSSAPEMSKNDFGR